MLSETFKTESPSYGVRLRNVGCVTDPTTPQGSGADAMARRARDRLQRAADSLRTGERRQDGKTTMLGPRAERTRHRLIDSASKLFAEKGYVATSVSDIAEDAGVSLGTFYQYFAERIDIVAVLVVEIIHEMLAEGVDQWDPRSGRLGLRRVVRAYVDSYSRHVDFFELWQSVTHVERRMRDLYRDYHGSYQYRFSRYLEAAAGDGLVRSDLEPEGMAQAMTLMMERYCYEIFVLDPPDKAPDHDAIIDLLVSLWADAIRLVESEDRPRRQTPQDSV